MKIIAIVGKTACGKDKIAKIFVDRHGYKYIVSTTTRKMRDGEREGVNYYYKDNRRFEKSIEDGLLLEYTYRLNAEGIKEYYGIEKDKINLEENKYVCVVDMKGAKALKEIYGNDVTVIYIRVDDDTRHKRYRERDQNHEEKDWVQRSQIENEEFVFAEKRVDHIIENYDINDTIYEINKIIELYS